MDEKREGERREGREERERERGKMEDIAGLHYFPGKDKTRSYQRYFDREQNYLY